MQNTGAYSLTYQDIIRNINGYIHNIQ